MTDFTPLQQKITQLNPLCVMKFQEPMSLHTSFRIGGPAEVMAFPKNTDELAEVLKLSHLLDCNFRILGAGTNVLSPDEGIRGIVICLKDVMDGMEALEGNRIQAFAGVTMTRLALFASKLGLSGLEFAHGIPGSVGGGIYMNAGAYGGELCHVCESVTTMDKFGNMRTRSNEEMAFSYRHSILEDTGEIAVSAIFKLTPGNVEEIKDKIKMYMAKRSASQPLDLPSAGSAFKRPIGGYAGALIEQAGLKGYQVGNAGISTKHAGFAVNLGGASAKDVQTLLKNVSDMVFAQSGIRLEPEVRIWEP